MKTTVLSVIITALLTFFITKTYVHTEQVHSIEIHDDHDHNEHSEDETHDDLDEISNETLQEFGVEFSTTSGGVLTRTIELPGEIIIDPNRLVHITPRYDGIVKEVYKFTGESVKSGDLLAIIESNESLSAYELRSSISGVIIDMHFTKGESVHITDNYFEIADLSEIWVNLNVYQKYLSEIKIDQTVLFSLNARTQNVQGKISFISPIINEHTRTAIARVVLKNSRGYFKPGQFLSGVVILDQSKCDIIIPKTAIETIGGLPAVFREDEHGFEPVYVQLGKQDHNRVEILSGLVLGQRFVSKGGFVLKTQMSKSMLTEAGCSH